MPRETSVGTAAAAAASLEAHALDAGEPDAQNHRSEASAVASRPRDDALSQNHRTTDVDKPPRGAAVPHVEANPTLVLGDGNCTFGANLFDLREHPHPENFCVTTLSGGELSNAQAYLAEYGVLQRGVDATDARTWPKRGVGRWEEIHFNLPWPCWFEPVEHFVMRFFMQAAEHQKPGDRVCIVVQSTRTAINNDFHPRLKYGFPSVIDKLPYTVLDVRQPPFDYDFYAHTSDVTHLTQFVFVRTSGSVIRERSGRIVKFDIPDDALMPVTRRADPTPALVAPNGSAV